MDAALVSRAKLSRRLIGALALIFLASVGAKAATLAVCPSGCAYTSIQAAVDAAAAGDVIDVGPGTYGESVEISVADLTIVGAGSDTTVIDGPLTPLEFEVGAGAATLAGVRLQSLVSGGCIRNYASLTVRDSVLENCANDENGGAIYTSGDLLLERVSVLFGDARFSGNFPSMGRGGGIYVDGDPIGGGPVVRIHDSVFAANQALYGAALYVGAGARAFVDGSYFTSNAAVDSTTDGATPNVGRGGAIRAFGELHVTHSTFYYNWAERYGGAIAINSSYAAARISNSVLLENFTAGDHQWVPAGGGVAVEQYGGDLRIVGTVFYGNNSAYGGGLGVNELFGTGAVALVQSSLVHNWAVKNGGGIWVYSLGGGEVTVKTSTLSSNTAEGNGGGAYGALGSGAINFKSSTIVDNAAFGSGGGVDPGGMTLRNSILARNSPTDCASTFDSEGHNLIGEADTCQALLPSDLSGTAAAPLDPMIGPLVDADGAIEAGTQSHAHVPLSGSPVVDTAGGCARVDQNGNGRPVDGGTGLARCDRGAVELLAVCGSPIRPSEFDPPNGSIDVAEQPLLVWEPTAGAVTFDAELSTRPPPFGAGVVAEVSGITATHWKPDITLLPGQTYYWRISAHSACGASTRSEVFSFTTS